LLLLSTGGVREERFPLLFVHMLQRWKIEVGLPVAESLCLLFAILVMGERESLRS
jgi:hypothetical protein